MTFGDYILDILLIAIVLRQIRWSKLDLRAVLLPVGICLYVGSKYLHDLPTGGNDLWLIGGFTVVGLVLGVVSGTATRVRYAGGRWPLVKAGWVAGGAWVLGMGFRFAFSIYANSHGGETAIGHFSASHGITSGDAWTDALVLMAFGEVFVRTGILWVRGQRAKTVQHTDGADVPARPDERMTGVAA